MPGIHWLVGYGPESDYSFHPATNNPYLADILQSSSTLGIVRPLATVGSGFAIGRPGRFSRTSAGREDYRPDRRAQSEKLLVFSCPFRARLCLFRLGGDSATL